MTGVVGCKERGRQVDGPLDHSTHDWKGTMGQIRPRYGDGWVKKNAGLKWMGAQYYDAKWVKKAITRLVLVETLFGWHCAAHQTVPPRVRQGSGGHQHGSGRCNGAASASASSFVVVHHTQQISMAAVAGDAETINKHARKNQDAYQLDQLPRECQLGQRQEQARASNGLSRVPVPLSSADVGPSTLHVRITYSSSLHRRCRGIACHVGRRVFLTSFLTFACSAPGRGHMDNQELARPANAAFVSRSSSTPLWRGTDGERASVRGERHCAWQSRPWSALPFLTESLRRLRW